MGVLVVVDTSNSVPPWCFLAASGCSCRGGHGLLSVAVVSIAAGGPFRFAMAADMDDMILCRGSACIAVDIDDYVPP